MDQVASRDLRNHTADVLKRVAGGDSVTITVNGSPAAVLSPDASPRRPYLTRSECIDLLSRHRADPGMAADLAELAGETTDDLGPIR